MRVLSLFLSILIFFQSQQVFSQDSSLEIIDQAFKEISYEIDVQDLNQQEIQSKSLEIAKYLKDQGVTSKDLFNYIGNQFNDQKSKIEFKKLVKLIQKQHLSWQESFERILPFFNQQKAQGSSFKDGPVVHPFLAAVLILVVVGFASLLTYKVLENH